MLLRSCWLLSWRIIIITVAKVYGLVLTSLHTSSHTAWEGVQDMCGKCCSATGEVRLSEPRSEGTGYTLCLLLQHHSVCDM